MSVPEEFLAARSALAAQSGASGWHADGMRIGEQLEAAAAMLTLGRAADVGGAELSLPPDAACHSDSQCTLVSCGPRRYLAVAFGEPGKRLVANLQRQFAARAAVVDYSDQLTFITLAGPKVARVLAALCSMDFDAAAFPAGRAAVTRLQDVRAFIWREPGDRFVVAVQRSLAVTAWESLMEAGETLAAE